MSHGSTKKRKPNIDEDSQSKTDVKKNPNELWNEYRMKVWREFVDRLIADGQCWIISKYVNLDLLKQDAVNELELFYQTLSNTHFYYYKDDTLHDRGERFLKSLQSEQNRNKSSNKSESDAGHTSISNDRKSLRLQLKSLQTKIKPPVVSSLQSTTVLAKLRPHEEAVFFLRSQCIMLKTCILPFISPFLKIIHGVNLSKIPQPDQSTDEEDNEMNIHERTIGYQLCTEYSNLWAYYSINFRKQKPAMLSDEECTLITRSNALINKRNNLYDDRSLHDTIEAFIRTNTCPYSEYSHVTSKLLLERVRHFAQCMSQVKLIVEMLFKMFANKEITEKPKLINNEWDIKQRDSYQQRDKVIEECHEEWELWLMTYCKTLESGPFSVPRVIDKQLDAWSGKSSAKHFLNIEDILFDVWPAMHGTRLRLERFNHIMNSFINHLLKCSST